MGRARRRLRDEYREPRTLVGEADDEQRDLWATKAAAQVPGLRQRFRDAWLLIDRDDQAQDNAERLYEWIAAHRPGTNLWFVLNRDSSDWDRLKKAGHWSEGMGETIFKGILFSELAGVVGGMMGG